MSSAHASRSGIDRASIVGASERDLPAVAELAGVIWRKHYPGIISVEQIEYMLARGYSLAALSRFITEEGAGLDLAYLGETLAGFAAYYRPGEPHELKLDKLYVHPDFHGRGLGRSLIASAEAAAIAQQRATLILNVNKNNVQAIRAYERMGFSVREAVVVDIGGGFVMDDYVMAKPLSP
jgi:ribosomal protein S18 acetylase RimI-like enzyme